MRVKSAYLAWRIFLRIVVAVGLYSQTLLKITPFWDGSTGRSSRGIALCSYSALSRNGLRSLFRTLMFELPQSRLQSTPYREGINRSSSLLVNLLLNRWL